MDSGIWSVGEVCVMNEESQIEIEQLNEEKRTREKNITKYKETIKRHCQKGCKIPEEHQRFFNQEIERPLALFSGQLLTLEQVTGRKSSSCSSHSAQTTSQSTHKPKDDSRFKASTKPLKAWKTTSVASTAHKEIQDSMRHGVTDGDTVELKPILVSETNVKQKHVTGYISKSCGTTNSGHININANLQSRRVIETPVWLPSVSCKDVCPCQHSQQQIMSTVQQPEGNSQSNQSNMVSQTASMPGLKKIGSTVDRKQAIVYHQPDQQTTMTEQLPQENSQRNQPNMVSYTKPVSGSTHGGSNVNQRQVIVIPQPGQQIKPTVHPKQLNPHNKSCNSVLQTIPVSGLTPGNPTFNLNDITRKPKTHQHSKPSAQLQLLAAGRQPAQNKIGSAQGKQVVTDQCSPTWQRYYIIQSDRLNPNYSAVLRSQPNHTNQPQNFQHQIPNQIIRNGSFTSGALQGPNCCTSLLPRQSSKLMHLQQGSQYVKHDPKIIDISATNRLAPDLVTSNIGASTSVPALDDMSPQLAVQHTRLLAVTNNADHERSVNIPGTSVSAQSVPYIPKQLSDNEQLTADSQNRTLTTSLTAAPAHTFIDGTSSCLSDNRDYSANVQDLPSLTLMELYSDANLFEKKPSGTAS